MTLYARHERTAQETIEDSLLWGSCPDLQAVQDQAQDPDYSVNFEEAARIAKSVTTDLSDRVLGTINDLLDGVPPSAYPLDLAQTLVDKFPPLSHAPDLPQGLLVLRRMCKREDLVDLVLESELLDHADLHQYCFFDEATRCAVTKVFYAVISARPDAAPRLAKALAEPLLGFLLGDTAYTSACLFHQTVCLADFVDCLTPPQVQEAFVVFTLFVLRTETHIVSQCLVGIQRCFYHDPSLAAQKQKPLFLETLYTNAVMLDPQSNLLDNDLAKNALRVLQYLVLPRAESYEGDTDFFANVTRVAARTIEGGSATARTETLYLLGYALTNPRFVETVDVERVLETFLQASESFSVEDKRAVAFVVGSALLYLPELELRAVVDTAQFHSCLRDTLAFDEKEILASLGSAIRRISLLFPDLLDAVFGSADLAALLDDALDAATEYKLAARTDFEGLRRRLAASD